MKVFTERSNNKRIFVFLLVALSLMVRLQSLTMPLGNGFHSFRQTQTAIVVQNYFRDGWSLLNYQVPVLGYPYSIIFECPIYQTIVYFFMLLFRQTNIDYCGRLISLLIFYLSAWMLKKMMDLIMDQKYSFYVFAVYLLLPFNIYWSTAVLIDYLSVLFALIYMYGLYGWLKTDRGYAYFISILFGSLGYLLKVTTMFPFVFFLAFLIVEYFIKQILQNQQHITLEAIILYIKNNIFKLMGLLILCCLPVFLGYLWTHYADFMKSGSIYTDWATSEHLASWNYGTLKQKTDLNNWKVILERLLGVSGGIYIVAFTVAVYIKNCSKKFGYIILSGTISIILTIFLLFNLYYVHDYYIIAIIPFICIFQGIILCEIVQVLRPERKLGNILIYAIGIALIYAQINSNRVYLDNLSSKENNSVGLYINKITDESERVFIEGDDWSPVTMYYAERKGFMLKFQEWMTEELFDNIIRRDNYTTLVANNLNNVSDFFNNFDIIIQFSNPNGPYIYKYYDQQDFDRIAGGHEYVSCNPDGDNYDIQNKQTLYVKFEYSEIPDDLEIPIVVVSQTGEQYSDTITLLKEKNTLYYNMDLLCNNPKTFWIENYPDLEINIKI